VLKLHPTIKPVRLIEQAILDCSRRGEVEWSIKVPEPTAIRQRGDVDPTIQVIRQTVRGDPRLFYLNIDVELKMRFAA